MLARPTLSILALLAAACGSDRTPAPPAAVPAQQPAPAAAPARPAEQLVRGIVKLTPSFTFQPCNAAALMTVLDSTGDRLVSSYHFMQATEQEGMYVLARGANSPQGQTVLRELEFAARPSATDGCQQPDPDYAIMVRGMEPPWTLKLTESVLEFSQPSAPEPLVFPATTPDDSAGLKRYQTATPGGLHTLHLLLSRTSCNEGRSGIYAAISASAVVDGVRLRGCGWRGRI